MTWRQLSQLLAYVSKFPTLLYYKMKGITPLYKPIYVYALSNDIANLTIISINSKYKILCAPFDAIYQSFSYL